ncbi:unnamed protein product [Prunus armeniaca]
MEVEQMDVKTAFLHGDLEEDIYMSQPQALKQSIRQWYKRFDSYMMKIGRESDMKDLDSTQNILGMKIRRDKVECPSTNEEKEEMSKVPHASLVGSLMYAVVCTRPDLAQAISVVPRYLKGTKKFGILFERQQGKACMSGYVDSDYAGVLDKRSALSTTEAKYMVLIEASKEAIWLKRLAKEFGIAQNLVELGKRWGHHDKEGSYNVEYFKLSNKASHNSKVQALFELAQSCSMLEIEVEFLGVIRTILKTLQMPWKAMISTRILGSPRSRLLGKLAHLKDTGFGDHQPFQSKV